MGLPVIIAMCFCAPRLMRAADQHNISIWRPASGFAHATSCTVSVVDEVLQITLSAAPWLLIGLIAAGLIKALVPESALQRWVGGRGIAGISRAAIIGAPLPLCSCGAIPTAFALHRSGAGRGPTTAFLIGTPGIGVDSIAISYALLGPFMAIARAGGAVATAVATGLLVANSRGGRPAADPEGATCASQCCSDACVGDSLADSTPASGIHSGTSTLPLGARLRDGMRFAFADLLDDISGWILIGLVIAGLLLAFTSPASMAGYGSGAGAMLLMAVIGIPLYICATAATPIAAGMLLAGVSPGTALVFLLAGPITSVATLAVLRREMGDAALALYLIGIIGTTVVIGLLADAAVAWTGVSVTAQVGEVRELLPEWLGWAALAVLVVAAVRPIRRNLGRLAPV
jgi:uncharacterized protein